jgi:nucleoid-associated protein YgaU
VKQGDTIDLIAFDEYGDSAMWRFIAATNNLDDPLRLKPGQVLAIAPQP